MPMFDEHDAVAQAALKNISSRHLTLLQDELADLQQMTSRRELEKFMADALVDVKPENAATVGLLRAAAQQRLNELGQVTDHSFGWGMQAAAAGDEQSIGEQELGMREELARQVREGSEQVQERASRILAHMDSIATRRDQANKSEGDATETFRTLLGGSDEKPAAD